MQPNQKSEEKVRTDTSPEDTRMAKKKKSIWKDAPHYMSLRNCELKQKWDITIHLLEWLKSKTLTIPNVIKAIENQELSCIAGRNAKRYSHLGRQFCSFLKIINIILPYDPIIMLLGSYANELKTYLHTKTYTWIFTAALFIIANTWK